MTLAECARQSTPWKDGVLGAICFCTDREPAQPQSAAPWPGVQIPMRNLTGTDSQCEVWLGQGKIERGHSGAIHYRHDGDLVFGALTLPEDTFVAGSGSTPLQQASESAYRQIFALLSELGYPHPFRFWNYVADINQVSFGLERYRQFNRGRQDAFLAHNRHVSGNVPAACALGSSGGPLAIAFLASRRSTVAIENPRQISAYRYPSQYGPSSPTFSRASLIELGQRHVLFVSGTASIVGHETLHAGDAAAQTHETLTNIEAVVGEANRLTGHTAFTLPALHYKVYVRHPHDLEAVREVLTHRLGPSPNAIYLQADVCRADLLVEIEATGWQPQSEGRRT